jgi:hypothetical protein
MQTTRKTKAESAIWARLLGPGGTSLSREAARAILDIDFSRADKERMHDLAARARRGTLTAAEEEEIDSYGRIGSFLSIMKSKARTAFRKLEANGSRRRTHEA